ncbi:ArsR/SmtB family transcription factor [Phytoactinopolyspora halotolerans]|uniref:Helix-turn-helix transcriptional regulator n=1 Tax=Phytoactinopolyspora halotolerans TaxID=1981512 RepID=A0A6L9S918_9ACTN|nr:metalloregulator ArsR/SmtB family transcription factor [Phytoactinopolyspora halotolerans]NEE01094.1 helix-turn-helix transcriptional regulator [Phytoactinopolyspora halotolerans]
MNQPDLDAVLVALAEPTRRTLLDLLTERGEASASALAQAMPVTRQAVVKHLGVLDDAGLVTGRRMGREVLYQARPERLEDAARRMSALAAVWETRLSAIKRLAETPEEGTQP